MNDYRTFSEVLCRSRYAVALTGAGISVESGIPDFRSKDGLWSRYDPNEYAYIESFRANPGKVWKMLAEIDTLVARVRPNQAHEALSEFERLGLLKAVVTQNIDSLHQRAGSVNVVEFHGHFRSLHCDACMRLQSREATDLEKLPPRCPCGGPLRPDIVFFGEGIPHESYLRAVEEAEKCDVMLVIGTSASVMPASQLPGIAKKAGARIIEINPSASELSYRISDLLIREPAGKALGTVLPIVRQMCSLERESK